MERVYAPPQKHAMTAPARLYLLTPRITDAAAFGPQLDAALATGMIACVLLSLSLAPGADTKKAARALAEIAQARDAALQLKTIRSW